MDINRSPVDINRYKPEKRPSVELNMPPMNLTGLHKNLDRLHTSLIRPSVDLEQASDGHGNGDGSEKGLIPENASNGTEKASHMDTQRLLINISRPPVLGVQVILVT